MRRLAEEQQTARHESRGDVEPLFPGSCAVSKEGSDFPSIEGAHECSSASSESCWDEMEDIGNEEVEWGALLRPPFGQVDDSGLSP